MAIRNKKCVLPQECARLFGECKELHAALLDAIARGEAAGVDMSDAIEFAGISGERMKQIAIAYYPDAGPLQ